MKIGEKVLLKEYKNGNRLWGTVTRCAKCEGTGKVIWTFADHRCFDCDGKGWYFFEERELTPANAAKLEAKRAKERAKWEAEQAEREAQQEAERAERAKQEAERLAEIERNRGRFVGNVGDKFQMEVTFERKFSYESHFGWKTVYFTGYILKTDDGNTLVWKTSGMGLCFKNYDVEHGHFCDDGERWYDYAEPQEGERITIKGTIKDHQEYNSVNQTIIDRVKWVR